MRRRMRHPDTAHPPASFPGDTSGSKSPICSYGPAGAPLHHGAARSLVTYVAAHKRHSSDPITLVDGLHGSSNSPPAKVAWEHASREMLDSSHIRPKSCKSWTMSSCPSWCARSLAACPLSSIRSIASTQGLLHETSSQHFALAFLESLSRDVHGVTGKALFQSSPTSSLDSQGFQHRRLNRSIKPFISTKSALLGRSPVAPHNISCVNS